MVVLCASLQNSSFFFFFQLHVQCLIIKLVYCILLDFLEELRPESTQMTSRVK